MPGGEWLHRLLSQPRRMFRRYVIEGPAIFGWLAAIVGSYKGLTAGGGPSGVGRAVNEAVIITFMLLFFVNALITAVYFQLIPQEGM